MKRNLTKRVRAPPRPKMCDPSMSFQDCELAILRSAVDEAAEIQDKKQENGPEIKKIMNVVEEFIIKKRLICYGGTAINNILPRDAQFYNKDTDIPDYDFFSVNALTDAKELADEYYRQGYEDVEAKSGVHFGTYKVFVNFIPVADITLLEKTIYQELQKESVLVAGIHYASPNWLRMGMYLELSRPRGDITRWEKVLTRLTLLNQYYPLKPAIDCTTDVVFQRSAEDYSAEEAEKIYQIVRDTFIYQDVVFFGGYALSLYAQYMPPEQRRAVQKIADFDVLSEEPEKTAMIVVEQLQQNGFTHARSVAHPSAGEILPEHIEILIGNETVAWIYNPVECVNYNILRVDNQSIKIATIDTILRYYLAFLYTGRPYFDRDRLICMSQFLFHVQQKNRLEQRGILRRFTMDCIGKQHTLEDIRAEKAELFKKLRGNKNAAEYEQWFLKYVPAERTRAAAAAQPPQAAPVEPPVEGVVPAQAPAPAPVKSASKSRRTTRRFTHRKNDFLFGGRRRRRGTKG